MRWRWALVVSALAALITLPGVAGVEAVTNDPYRERQWGLTQIRAERAWETSTGDVLVAIVDSGIDFDHPDLAGKVVPGKTFLECGEEGCGDGDWDSGPPERRDLRFFHGTHVAGIVGAATNNGVGVAGVAPGARLLAVKVGDRKLDEPLPPLDAGEIRAISQDIAWGIRYAADRGARVINLSLGWPAGEASKTVPFGVELLTSAVAYANERGTVVVAAAGNENLPLCSTPGFDPGVVCVAATDQRELRAWYSSFPVKPDLLAVSAPGGGGLRTCGEGVVSTVPPEPSQPLLPVPLPTSECGYDAGYAEYSGTSMAAPHVAGVAALLAAQGRSRQNVIDALTATARKPHGDVRGVYDPVYGFGIVDAAEAVRFPVT